MMANLLFFVPLAGPPRSETELHGTFLLLIVLVAAVGVYLWLILARFSRPP
ncbi:MAG: hypothetical protein HY334_07750 [Armatimonadetes bacterium]|nr:hypothetical protein [Armatimonadota bacterium]